MVQSFKPFLENSTAEEKLSLLTKSSFIKPSRRTQKMLDKQQANPQANSSNKNKCPVYKCEIECKDASELQNHYDEKHTDLKELGLSLKTNQRSGIEAEVKDTLLAQLICFAITNKSQVRRFQIDHDNEIYESLKRQKKVEK